MPTHQGERIYIYQQCSSRPSMARAEPSKPGEPGCIALNRILSAKGTARGAFRLRIALDMPNPVHGVYPFQPVPLMAGGWRGSQLFTHLDAFALVDLPAKGVGILN